LLVSEIVTNAIRYSRASERGRIHLTATCDQDGGLHVEVIDPGGDTLPAPGSPPADIERGRGLLIVEALADDWGFRPHGDRGLAVWFHLGPHG
jgi:serine/threonine-protein kinase RsbW